MLGNYIVCYKVDVSTIAVTMEGLKSIDLYTLKYCYSGTCVTVTWIKQSPLHNGHGHEVPNIFPYKCMYYGLHYNGQPRIRL